MNKKVQIEGKWYINTTEIQGCYGCICLMKDNCNSSLRKKLVKHFNENCNGFIFIETKPE